MRNSKQLQGLTSGICGFIHLDWARSVVGKDLSKLPVPSDSVYLFLDDRRRSARWHSIANHITDQHIFGDLHDTDKHLSLNAQSKKACALFFKGFKVHTKPCNWLVLRSSCYMGISRE